MNRIVNAVSAIAVRMPYWSLSQWQAEGQERVKLLGASKDSGARRGRHGPTG